MRKKLWYRAECIAAAALLLGGSVMGIRCRKVSAAGEDTEDTGILLEEEALWTDEENYQAEITVKIRGLKAYLKKQEETQNQEKVPEPPEENGGEPGREDTEPEIPGGEESGSEKEEPEPEISGGEDSGSEKEGTEPEIPEGEKSGSEKESTEPETPEGKESGSQKEGTEPEIPGGEESRSEREGTEPEIPGEEESGSKKEESDLQGSAEETGKPEKERSISWEGDFSETGLQGEAARQEPVAGLISRSQSFEEAQELFSAAPSESDGGVEGNIYLIYMLSRYFEPERGEAGEEIRFEEVSGGNEQEGIIYTRVSLPIDPGFAAQPEDSLQREEGAAEEDCIQVSLPVRLREPWRVTGEGGIYPLCADGTSEFPGAKGGICLVCREEKEQTLLSSSEGGALEVRGSRAEFQLSLSDGGLVPRAGQSFRYQVTVENTGTLPLRDIYLKSAFSADGISGSWEDARGLEKGADGVAVLGTLPAGESRMLAFTAEIPEAFSGKLACLLSAASEDPLAPGAYLRREAAHEAGVAALKADFSVTKSANRKKAAPGDTITYQICIRNTGERTLHSVVSTERFLEEDIPAEFLEKEGVLLSEDRTKALIRQIPPGEVVSLEARVALPGNLKSGRLINQVVVVTEETGKKEILAQAGVDIEDPYPSAVPIEQESENGDPGSPVSAPRTGDETRPELWAWLMGGALLAACAACFRRKWAGKE